MFSMKPLPDSPLNHALILKYQEREHILFLTNRTYSIGRQVDNDLSIPDTAISRYHCTLLPVNYSLSNAFRPVPQLVFWIIDGNLHGERSTNGIFVNGERCLSHELKIGDRIHFSGSTAEIIYDQVSSSSADLSLDSLEFLPVLSDSSEQNNGQETKSTTVIYQNILTTILENITLLLQRQQSFEYAQFEMDLKGNFIRQNSLYIEQFPLLVQAYQGNPFIKYLIQELIQSETDFCCRRVKYQGKLYTQYARLIPDANYIKSYIFDFETLLHKKKLLESEEKYRSIVRQAGQGIFLIDPLSQKILEANQAYCCLVGYSSTEIVQVKLSQLLGMDDQVLKSLLRMIQQQRLTVIRESIHYGQNGERIPVEENISIIHYSTSEVICYSINDLSKRKLAEQKLAKSLAEKELLLKEVHHRVKNNLLVVSSLLNWQGESIQDPAILQVFTDSQKRIHSIALIHEKLYRSTDLVHIDFGDYVQTLATQIFDSFCSDRHLIQLHFSIDSVPLNLNIETATPCGLIVNELILNALEHAFLDNQPGNLFLTLEQMKNGGIMLQVKDDGKGLPKGFNFRKSESLGWQLICLLIEQLEGNIQVSSQNGTQVTLTFQELLYRERL